EKDKNVLKALEVAGRTASSDFSIALPSNLFPVTLGEYDEQGAVAYNAYRLHWGDGPNVPIVAQVFFRDSTGREVLAPCGWGRREVLWDFAYVNQNQSIP